MSKTKQIKELKKTMKSFSKVAAKSLNKIDKLDLDPMEGFNVKHAFYRMIKGKYNKETVNDNSIERIYDGFCSYDFNREDEGEINHVYREFGFSIFLGISKKELD